jgi:hypothetical protein
MLNLILFAASAVCFLLALIGVGKFDFGLLGLMLLALGHIPFGTLDIRK